MMRFVYQPPENPSKIVTLDNMETKFISIITFITQCQYNKKYAEWFKMAIILMEAFSKDNNLYVNTIKRLMRAEFTIGN